MSQKPNYARYTYNSVFKYKKNKEINYHQLNF